MKRLGLEARAFRYACPRSVPRRLIAMSFETSASGTVRHPLRMSGVR